MRIIGVDPGSRATGYGVIDDDRGGLRHVSHGVIKPPRVDDLPARLAWIFKELGRVISEVRPEIASGPEVAAGLRTGAPSWCA